VDSHRSKLPDMVRTQHPSGVPRSFKSATAAFQSSGEDIAEMLRCIEISRPWFPPNRVESILQNAKETYYLRLIARASQDDVVLRLVDELINVSKPGLIHRNGIADGLLRAAYIHHRQGRSFQALGFLMRALLTRPVIAGRPLKRAATALLRKSQVKAGQA
jgi:hypothetical protein